jgi:energy-coupling factor transport system ATP-binding protein
MSTAQVPAVEFHQVSFAYAQGAGDAKAVAEVSFRLPRGTFTAIVGSNGAGKTTLSKLMNGLLKPTSGQVWVVGRSTADTPTSALARHVGMLFQNPDHQICQQSVRDEIAFTLRLQGVEDVTAQARAVDVAASYGLDPDADPFMLSRSHRQLLALASVVAGEPEVLVLDEPTNGMDGRTCRMVMDRVRALRENGTTIIMITHDMELAFENAQRLLVMEGGRLIADGGPETVFRAECSRAGASVLAPQMIELSEKLAAEGGDARLFAYTASVPQVLSAMRAAGVDKKVARKREVAQTALAGKEA